MAGAGSFTTLVTITARFRSTEGEGGLLRHIGAISELAGIRHFYRLALRSKLRRLRSEKMKEGKVPYFEQVDNPSGTATYRLHVAEAYSPLQEPPP